MSKADIVVYRHNDLEHLQSQMANASGRKIVFTDAVFSMDGDLAPLEELGRLCVTQDALLVLDEAHSILDLELELPQCAGLQLLRVGTLSKTLGSFGGWVTGSRSLIHLLVNRARTFIYTTGLSPPDTAAALAALQVVRGPEGQRLRTRLRQLIDLLEPNHPSPIMPIVLGSDRAALSAAEVLLAAGLYVPAIRPPTVAVGTARLRIALSAAYGCHGDAAQACACENPRAGSRAGTTMTRPARLVAVVGTRTDVEKTWVSQALLSQWKARGQRVAARKPVQSFKTGTGDTDAELLARVTGEDPSTVCPRHR